MMVTIPKQLLQNAVHPSVGRRLLPTCGFWICRCYKFRQQSVRKPSAWPPLRAHAGTGCANRLLPQELLLNTINI